MQRILSSFVSLRLKLFSSKKISILLLYRDFFAFNFTCVTLLFLDFYSGYFSIKNNLYNIYAFRKRGDVYCFVKRNAVIGIL